MQVAEPSEQERQAAPFSKGERSSRPKRPGRSSRGWMGSFSYRKSPSPDEVTEAGRGGGG